ncbi:hypothetical protein CDL15_Pgr006577 [Punica granatum]|uniref:Uncharacterized protein n=1 Tax=Punica granatum TaxID=22663 RepID=A0A218Y038_PUNGR|nr:hypothetical protein CDL15_Pgr006577 [Punica granatum]
MGRVNEIRTRTGCPFSFRVLGVSSSLKPRVSVNHGVSTPFWPTGFPHGDSRPKPGTLFITRQPEANRRARGHEQWEKSWVTEKSGESHQKNERTKNPEMAKLALWHYSSLSHRSTERCPIWGFKNPSQCQGDQ